MAELRSSGKQTAARQRAREKAAEYREKQNKLEQLATDFFVASDSIEGIDANVEKEIAAARERGKKHSADARAKADAVIVAMLELGAPRNEIADRLGIATRDVKRATPVSVGASTSTPSDDESAGENV